MELASMLAGERFGDRPASVCPIVGSILRLYNDVIDDRRRVDLYRYSAEAVGTRGDFELQHDRAAVAIAWARAGYEKRPWSWRALANTPQEPAADSGPDGIAEYVIGSLRRRHSAGAHAATLWMLDRLIAMTPTPTSTNVSLGAPIEVSAAAAAPIAHQAGDRSCHATGALTRRAGGVGESLRLAGRR
jgi:hypothetical protein